MLRGARPVPVGTYIMVPRKGLTVEYPANLPVSILQLTYRHLVLSKSSKHKNFLLDVLSMTKRAGSGAGS
jgi:hypothetical protein